MYYHNRIGDILCETKHLAANSVLTTHAKSGLPTSGVNLKVGIVAIVRKYRRSKNSVARGTPLGGRLLRSLEVALFSNPSEVTAAAANDESMPEKDKDINDEGTIQTSKISHREELKTVETSLQYFE
ncbi:hypothetical protein TNCV_2392451 [Trichonephila clavipes]|nr:hypothetical protein TNCV_2392451 [Trichonephila clavipes]